MDTVWPLHAAAGMIINILIDEREILDEVEEFSSKEK